MLKVAVRDFLYKVAPETMTAIQSARARAFSHKWLKETGVSDLTQKLVATLGDKVLSGPFKEMTLTPMTFGENLGPYLLGVFEAELHPWLERSAGMRFSQVLDIGSKFGYYAVGLAKMHPEAASVAFDTDWWARKATMEMIASNAVSNCEVKGFCNVAWLEANLRDDAFILSDCEGYERQLFCGSSCPRLDTATMIIETHDCLSAGITEEIQARFTATHAIERVSFFEKTKPPGVDFRTLTEEEIRAAMNELRPEQDWLFLTPKRRAG